MNLTTVPELSLEVVAPGEMMSASLLSEDLRFKERLGASRHAGAIAAVGRNSVTLRNSSEKSRLTSVGHCNAGKENTMTPGKPRSLS